jgi:hypothetical protein
MEEEDARRELGWALLGCAREERGKEVGLPAQNKEEFLFFCKTFF